MLVPPVYVLTCALALITAEDPLRTACHDAAAAALPTYEWLHAHPELSGSEQATAARFAAELKRLTPEVFEQVGGHGVVAILRNSKSPQGPTVLYRADMDALPVTEATGLAYASTVPGVMHACGHDVHMSTALAVANVLHAHEAQWRGTLVLVGQPAEELGSGARAMLKDPQWAKILAKAGPVKLALAWHDDAGFPAGSVGLRSGPITAGVDGVDIVVHGKGGHGAKPHQTIDATVIGAEIVGALQTIVSRTLPPGEQAVVTVGQFISGTKRNIIAPTATLKLTVRTYDAGVRTTVLKRIHEIATHLAAAHDVPQPPDVLAPDAPVPSVINDAAWTERLRGLLVEKLGAEQVGTAEQSMGGEDFSEFGAKWPLVLMRLGAVEPHVFARTPAADLPGIHSEKWAPDALPTLQTGVYGMVLAIGLATQN